MHIYSRLRKKHHIPEELFSPNGKLLFTDIRAVRDFLHQFNSDKDKSSRVYTGEMKVSSLLQNVYSHIITKYGEEIGFDPCAKAAGFLEKQYRSGFLDSFASSFIKAFPPKELLPVSEIIHESIVLYVANENPANKKLKIFFDKNYLEPAGVFDRVSQELEGFFKELPAFGPEKQNILAFLKTPGQLSPDSLNGQIEYILHKWKHLLPEDLILNILIGRDILKEEQMSRKTAIGAPPPLVPGYKAKGDQLEAYAEQGHYDEEGRFTQDTHWMPRVVLIAKNTYVWLDQLSKKYGREIVRLDQIPDQELDILEKRNFNGLWLIGIWERSPASRKIKHLMGNPDAISSAYALYDYEIAGDLGGDKAYENLNARARQRGIRLASDMVPNHTGIFSKWVLEKPGHFIQAERPPFPGYSFTGENLSDHPGIELRIEDGYYDRSDAAVVFERIDRQNNDVRYIYHGNDGTMMPWNDTAQLDLIKAEVREEVMQKIFDVAGKFSIIRFDAAMTLAKKHFARLWYPQPGTGGDIPSRSEYSMSKKDFDRLFPVEFWREVVDRINAEMPETLLLAEAFWLMEGYFVRTLGMHRVYNSAFMHMLKNEENEKYRDLIIRTLEFEPEILKRYVNFMSNPDEETAIGQFGSGDKYFGVCLLMNTLPGLPMYAHGQVEGLSEKYGMEYKRAYHAEEEKEWLIQRHEKDIFPLAGKRYLFSEVKHFNLYDYRCSSGAINQNVFAYSNRYGREKAVVFFNNKYDSTDGGILRPVPRIREGQEQFEPVTIARELEFNQGGSYYYRAIEQISGLEYLFRGEDVHSYGIHFPLQGFEYRVFLDFEQMYDHDGSLYRLFSEISGQGVKSVRDELKLRQLRKLHTAFEVILDRHLTDPFVESILHPEKRGTYPENTEPLQNALTEFTYMVSMHEGSVYDNNKAGKLFRSYAKALGSITGIIRSAKKWYTADKPGPLPIPPEDLLVITGRNACNENALNVLTYIATASASCAGPNKSPVKFFKELELGWPLQRSLQRSGRSIEDTANDPGLVRILLKLFEKDSTIELNTIRQMLSDNEVLSLIGTNQYQNQWYYSKERFELLLKWVFSISALELVSRQEASEAETIAGRINDLANTINEIARISDNSAYRLENLKKMLDENTGKDQGELIR